MKHAIMLEGEMVDEHTIHIEKALPGVSGKFKLLVELPGKPTSNSDSDDFKRYFTDIHVDLKGFKFDREEANER